MTKQLGFIVDVSRCIQCRTCEVSCKINRNVEPGVKWRKVVETWIGQYPDITCSYLSKACMHCAKPVCVAVCPTKAIKKRAEDGVVVVEKEKCNGCRECSSACPFDAPRFGADGIMQKCDFCVGREGGPACIGPCPAEAISYGDINHLPALKNGKSAERLKGPTHPSLIIVKKA